jgi:hypothetical protein
VDIQNKTKYWQIRYSCEKERDRNGELKLLAGYND